MQDVNQPKVDENLSETLVEKIMSGKEKVDCSEVENRNIPDYIKQGFELQIDTWIEKVNPHPLVDGLNWENIDVIDAFRQLKEILKSTVIFSYDNVRRVVFKATKAQNKYVLMPHTTLLEIIYEDIQTCSTEIILKTFSVFKEYPYYMETIQKYFDTKNIAIVSREKFKSLIIKIDKKLLSQDPLETPLKISKTILGHLRKVNPDVNDIPTESLIKTFSDRDYFDYVEVFKAELELERSSMSMAEIEVSIKRYLMLKEKKIFSEGIGNEKTILAKPDTDDKEEDEESERMASEPETYTEPEQENSGNRDSEERTNDDLNEDHVLDETDEADQSVIKDEYLDSDGTQPIEPVEQVAQDIDEEGTSVDVQEMDKDSGDQSDGGETDQLIEESVFDSEEESAKTDETQTMDTAYPVQNSNEEPEPEPEEIQEMDRDSGDASDVHETDQMMEKNVFDSEEESAAMVEPETIEREYEDQETDSNPLVAESTEGKDQTDLSELVDEGLKRFAQEKEPESEDEEQFGLFDQGDLLDSTILKSIDKALLDFDEKAERQVDEVIDIISTEVESEVFQEEQETPQQKEVIPEDHEQNDLIKLETIVREKEKEDFIKKIFDGDEKDYNIFVQMINEIGTWKRATLIVDNEFLKRDVNPYSKEALRLTDLVYKKYGHLKK